MEKVEVFIQNMNKIRNKYASQVENNALSVKELVMHEFNLEPSHQDESRFVVTYPNSRAYKSTDPRAYRTIDFYQLKNETRLNHIPFFLKGPRFQNSKATRKVIGQFMPSRYYWSQQQQEPIANITDDKNTEIIFALKSLLFKDVTTCGVKFNQDYAGEFLKAYLMGPSPKERYEAIALGLSNTVALQMIAKKVSKEDMKAMVGMPEDYILKLL